MGRCPKVLMPVMLVFFLFTLSTRTDAESASPATNDHVANDPFPAAPGLRPQVEFWIDVFTRLRRNQVLLHDTQYPRLRYEVFVLPGTVEDGLNREQADYLVRYYLLTLGTGLVERVFWWRLIAWYFPGFLVSLEVLL